MASSQTSAYFPPLDHCLNGSSRLIPWKTAWRALCDPSSALENSTLEAFLSDDESKRLLSNSLNPFLEPSSRTKSDFDTKTAQIQVAQSSNGEYDLEQLKTDALWLSKEVKVEELVALRVVVLEWQGRADEALLIAVNGNGSNTVLAIPDLGGSALGASRAALGASVNSASSPAIDLGKEETRRQRQLQTYLEEKSYIARISADLIGRAAVRQGHTQTSGNWIDELAHHVLEEQCKPTSATGYEAFVSTCLESLNKIAESIDDNTKRPEIFRSEEAKQLIYASAAFAKLATVLRLLLISLHASEIVPSAKTLSLWFKFMETYSFFQELSSSAALPDPSPIQCLASFVSTAILRMPTAISSVQTQTERLTQSRAGAVQYPNLPAGSTPYYESESCLKDVNTILHSAALARLSIASPAMLAWGLFAGIVRDATKYAEQSRAPPGESSDGENTLRRSRSRQETLFERQHAALTDLSLPDVDGEAKADAAALLLRQVIDDMCGLDIIAQLCIAATAIWGSENDESTSFVARSMLLELIRQTALLVTYGEEIMAAILAILAPDVHARSTRLDHRLADCFIDDQEIFEPLILRQACARYPFELSPLLKLFICLAASKSEEHGSSAKILQVLENMQGVTVMVPEHFRNYVLDHEDENENSIALTENLPLFVSKQARAYFGEGFSGHPALTMGSGDDNSISNVLQVPAGASGIVIKESRPLVIQFEHRHSALEYLGLALSTIRPTSKLLLAPMDFELDRSTAADLINLIVAILKATLCQQHGIDECRVILAHLSFALPEGTDITAIVADIFETELLAHLDRSVAEGSLELLTACADYLSTVLSITPERVWTALHSSVLLGISGGAPALAAVVGGSEVQIGRYTFLLSCVRLFHQLVDDAILGLVKRKTRPNSRTANRFDSPMMGMDNTSERSMAAVIGAFQDVVIDAWLSLEEWRFILRTEKTKIGTSVFAALQTLLKTVFGVGAEGKKLGAWLVPVGRRTVERLGGGDTSVLKSFAAAFSAGAAVADDGLSSLERQALVEQVHSFASLITLLLRIKNTTDAKEGQASELGTQLTKMMPIFAVLIGTEHAYKGSVSTLLTEVVRTIDSTEKDPPSLLGQLSAEGGKQFLNVVSNLDRPLRDVETECSIWGFLTAIVSSKQQWFAIYLLTGTLPKDRLKQTTSSTRKSLLTHALDVLSDITNLPPDRALAMLKFIAAAQSAWVWATNEIRSHADFLKNIIQWLSQLSAPTRAGNMAEETLAAGEYAMAAQVCSILAVNIHAGLEVGNTRVIEMCARKLGFLCDDAGAVDAYNRSLHLNLAENFARKFETSGCTVADFIRTAANPTPYGRDFYYDTRLAGRVLGHDRSWRGSGNRATDQGFRDEFARANVNMSFYAAQKELLAAWETFATTICEYVRKVPNGQGSRNLQNELARTVDVLLRANREARLETPGMDAVVNARVRMAFTLLSTLVGIKAECKEANATSRPAIKDLLLTAWDLVRVSPVDYDIASSPEDMNYYRLLLQVLYLTIQPHIYIAPEGPGSQRSGTTTNETPRALLEPAVANCLTEIVAKVIAPGFRALCGNLHTNVELALPADFALLTAILRAILSVQGAEVIYQQISEIVASSSLIRGALSLYSWSDQLAVQMQDPETGEQDPIYGELAILFLLALSTVTAIAEQMALNNVLTHISSANLSNAFRKPGGKGPFDPPPRMFTIWAEGLLPLCLNLLDAVGAPVAADVSAFLNSFLTQLKRAETALENRAPSARNPHAGAVTLGLVSEAHSLCLISQILSVCIAYAADEGLNGNDIPKLDFDADKVRDEALGLARQKTSLKSRVVAVGEREEEWRRMSGGSGADDLLMVKVDRELQGLRMLGRGGDGE